MMGIIILGRGKDPEWDNKIFYRIGNRTVLEHVIASAISVECAHKIIIGLDLADMSSITGTAFNIPIINHDMLLLDPRLQFAYSDKKDEIGKIYDICIQHQLDDVIVLEADDLLLPAWLIKELIEIYILNNKVPCINGLHPPGFSVKIYPFSVVANIKRFSTFPDKLNSFTNKIGLLIPPNTGNVEVPSCNISLKLKVRDQLPVFDAIIEDLRSGADIADIISAFNE